MIKCRLSPSLGRKIQEQIMLVLFHLVSSSSSVLPCLASKDLDTAMVSQGGSKSPASLLCPGKGYGQQWLRTADSYASPDLPGRVFRVESSQALQCHCSAGSCQHLKTNTGLPLQSHQRSTVAEHTGAQSLEKQYRSCWP